MAWHVTTNKWEIEKKGFAYKMLRIVGSDGLDVMRFIEKHPKGVTTEQIISGTGLKNKIVLKELRDARKHRLVKLVR